MYSYYDYTVTRRFYERAPHVYLHLGTIPLHFILIITDSRFSTLRIQLYLRSYYNIITLCVCRVHVFKNNVPTITALH